MRRGTLHACGEVSVRAASRHRQRTARLASVDNDASAFHVDSVNDG